MKHDLKSLFEEVEDKLGKKLNVSSDLEKLMSVFSKRNIHLKRSAFKGVWEHLKTVDKLSPETLDKIALLVGFQSWSDFQEALHGDDDGQVSYESDDSKDK